MLGLRAGRWSFSTVQCLLMGGILLGCATFASAQDVARVEEDWELTVGVPDPNSSSPQVVTVISTGADLSSWHAAFLVNHQTGTSFQYGGLQLQAWDGDVNKSYQRIPDNTVLNTENEVVRWTLSMELVPSGLQFAVTNGSSTTWGTFGNKQYLRATVSARLANLNGHSSTVSRENSGTVVAAHRVESLRLLATRRYTADGSLIEDVP